MLQGLKMPLRQVTSLWGRGLTVWLALCMVEGKDAGLLPGEENGDVKGEFEWVVSSGLPTECGPRKLTKRSSSSDVLWLRDLGSREANCQIFSVTTALPRITPSKVSTKDPRKATTKRIKTASPEEGPRLLYFRPYYPHRQHTFYHVLFPVHRGARGHNALWYYKSVGEDSSEEKRRKRDILLTRQKRNIVSLEGQNPASSPPASLGQTVQTSQWFTSCIKRAAGRESFLKGGLIPVTELLAS